MTFQTCIVLALVALCVLYFLKDLFRSAVTGGCGGGCGSCKSGGCPVKKLEAPHPRLDPPTLT